MKTRNDSNIGRMPELTEFEMIYSAIGSLIVVDLSMKDSLSGHIDNPHDFPNFQLSIRAEMARDLANEILRCVDAIEAGMHHPSLRFDF
ncbi:hypothetical protein [Pantoea piersonii]|uniref:hypothetical protein n=1 Tax=Pantoea piersonii TaxID=2364647 RepID=UPI0022F1AEC8|nr:hypothetical protein [Pantoea piersonii]WBV23052.1 hypothetical protein PG877_07865 [Pantoea piersonii]